MFYLVIFNEQQIKEILHLLFFFSQLVENNSIFFFLSFHYFVKNNLYKNFTLTSRSKFKFLISFDCDALCLRLKQVYKLYF